MAQAEPCQGHSLTALMLGNQAVPPLWEPLQAQILVPAPSLPFL